ncbi:uncharacterized protein A4U43_C05F34630 [Asparagus officinalis]|uniref:Uncharacterized protein n=1 Tax=Asparagus officinalis TaxID=4686 RepID=A0A5P1EWV5_ASPOF|nr:uncharacterized protein A4U43_C05F34630 [Asparagus officinalis]
MATKEIEGYWGLTAKRCRLVQDLAGVLCLQRRRAPTSSRHAGDSRVHGASPLASRQRGVWLMRGLQQALCRHVQGRRRHPLRTCDADIHAASPLAAATSASPSSPSTRPSTPPSNNSARTRRWGSYCGDEEDNESKAATWMTTTNPSSNPNPNGDDGDPGSELLR